MTCRKCAYMDRNAGGPITMHINEISYLPFTHRGTYINTYFHMHIDIHPHTPCAGSRLSGRVCFLLVMMSSEVNNEGDRRTNTGSGVQTPALRTHTHSRTHIIHATQLYSQYNMINAYTNAPLLVALSIGISPKQNLHVCRFLRAV